MVYSNSEDMEHFNMEKAIDYLEKAAKQNNQFAEYCLGYIYSNQELPQYYDIDKALFYFHHAADKGNSFAQCKLGIMYYFGKGVQQNQELGRYYLQMSSSQGNQFAYDVLNGMGIGINFSYCLIKSSLSALERFNMEERYNNEIVVKTQSRQALREKQLHKDNAQDI